MPSRLKRLSPFPSGEFSYSQLESFSAGQWSGKVLHSWEGGGLSLEQMARLNVLPFRTLNHLARATLAETIDDINLFTCARLGNNPRYCSDGSQQVQVQASGGGGCCGVKLGK